MGCKKANDTTPPIILLKGANPYPLILNSAYVEPGVIATDNVDGDVSSQVVINGISSININLKGTYSVNYTVKDAAGNVYSATRKVIVVNSADSLAGNYSVADTCLSTIPFAFNSRISVSNTTNGLIKIFDFINVGDSIIANLTSNDTLINFTPSQYLGSGDSLISAVGYATTVDTSFIGSAPKRSIMIYYKWYNGTTTDSCKATYLHL